MRIRSWFVIAWSVGFLAGIALALMPDRLMSQTAKALTFFCFFPPAIVAWTFDVVRHGGFNSITKRDQPIAFWSVIVWNIALALLLTVFLVYRLSRL